MENHCDMIKEKLKLFLELNPITEIEEIEHKIRVIKPWGDSSLLLGIKNENDSIIDALNNIILPNVFSALYHTDTKDLEFIYTPYRNTDTENRKFEFTYTEKTYTCEFAPPSDRLLLITKAFEQKGPKTLTGYRNLQDMRLYMNLDNRYKIQSIFSPSSFWIRNIEMDDTSVVNLARHINFYMHYFDKETPIIIIHDEFKDEFGITTERYPFSSFPEKINARNLDTYIMGLWQSAIEATDVFRQFLYYYQIIEYAAFYYMNDKLLKEVTKILCAPETTIQPLMAARKILDSLSGNKTQDEAKIAQVIEELIDPVILWNEINANKSTFCQDVLFDGGFRLRPLLNENTSLDQFLKSWTPSFANSIRSIRNALVHSRESKQADSIAPTHQNYNRLLYWKSPLAAVAMQIAAKL